MKKLIRLTALFTAFFLAFSLVSCKQDDEEEDVTYKISVDGGTASYATAKEGTIVKITASDPPAEKEFTHWEADGVDITRKKRKKEFTFAMPANDVSFTAIYTGAVIDLSKLTSDLDAHDGVILKGKTDKYKVTIDNGATVTLKNAEISKNDSAGIICSGNATIILADGTGNNKVTITNGNFPAIQVGAKGTTLTIQGTDTAGLHVKVSDDNIAACIGSANEKECGNIVINEIKLTAENSGIGSGSKGTCGDITINEADITVTSANGSAGIGSGADGSCGKITITKSTITSTGGNGSAGIGSGSNGECGDISISGETVTSKGGKNGAGIGSGSNGNCGDITISGKTFTSTGGESAAGIGSGSQGKCGSIIITEGTFTVTGGENASGIGSGSSGECGGITISGGTVSATGGKNASGIGSGSSGKCDSITLTKDVTKVTGAKDTNSPNDIDSIGRGKDGDCGTVTLNNTVYWNGDTQKYEQGGNIILQANPCIYDPKDPPPKIVDLSGRESDYTADRNDILTCSNDVCTGRVIIPDGYKVTLSGVRIVRDHRDSTITCKGNATIILEEGTENEVQSGNSGILVGPQGKTLTIDGKGSLTVKTKYQAAGIGAEMQMDCGDIHIKGGNITVTGGADCAAIGSGYGAKCGNITIENTVTSVTAEISKPTSPSLPDTIGKGGGDATCGTVTIGGVPGEITESPYTYQP